MIAWGVVVYRDGEPVTGLLETDDWYAATAVAPFFAGWLGQVSVAQAVVAARPLPEPDLTLFEEVA